MLLCTGVHSFTWRLPEQYYSYMTETIPAVSDPLRSEAETRQPTLIYRKNMTTVSCVPVIQGNREGKAIFLWMVEFAVYRQPRAP